MNFAFTEVRIVITEFDDRGGHPGRFRQNAAAAFWRHTSQHMSRAWRLIRSDLDYISFLLLLRPARPIQFSVVHGHAATPLESG